MRNCPGSATIDCTLMLGHPGEHLEPFSKEEGVKHDDIKPPLGLLSTYALTETAKVLAFGAEKYAEDNWRQGLSYRRLVSAALRHILAFNEGQDEDPETELPHLAHAMCMIMFALELSATNPDLDDRYKHQGEIPWLDSLQ